MAFGRSESAERHWRVDLAGEKANIIPKFAECAAAGRLLRDAVDEIEEPGGGRRLADLLGRFDQHVDAESNVLLNIVVERIRQTIRNQDRVATVPHASPGLSQRRPHRSAYQTGVDNRCK